MAPSVPPPDATTAAEARADQRAEAVETRLARQLNTALDEIVNRQRIQQRRGRYTTGVGVVVAFLLAVGLFSYRADQQADDRRLCESSNDARRGLNKVATTIRNGLVGAGANAPRSPEAQAARDQQIADFDRQLAEGLADLQPQEC